MSEILRLNVGGKDFEVDSSILKRFQYSRLTRLYECRESARCRELLCDDFDESSEVYFFDRDPDVFFWILRCYRQRVVHIPKSICAVRFAEEQKYWGIDDAVLDGNFTERLEDAKALVQEFEEKARICERTRSLVEEHGAVSFTSIRGVEDIWKIIKKIRWTIWLGFNEPSSSVFGKLWAVISVSVILLSLVTFVVETLPSIQVVDEDGHEVENESIALIEEICNVWFTMEYLLRLLASSGKIAFIRQPMNVIDLITIIPYYVQLFLSLHPEYDGELGSVSHVFQIFRVMRVMRVLRLGRHSSGLQVLCKTMVKSSSELALLGLYMLIGILIIATAVQCLEPNIFPSIGEALWWATITITTVGYGDIYPETIPGKLVATLAFFAGVFVIGVPTHPVIANFTDYYQRAAEIENAFERNRKKEELLATMAANGSTGDDTQVVSHKSSRLRRQSKGRLNGNDPKIHNATVKRSSLSGNHSHKKCHCLFCNDNTS